MSNLSTYKFTLDYHSHKSQVSLPVMVGDTKSRLHILLTDGGVPYFIEDGCRAVFVATKPSGATLVNDCIVEDNSIVRYDFTGQTTNEKGVIKCEIRLYDIEGRTLTTPRFIMVVDPRVEYDSDIISESESTVLDRIIVAEEERVEAETAREERVEQFIEDSNARVDECITEVDEAFEQWNVAETAREDRSEQFIEDSNARVEECIEEVHTELAVWENSREAAELAVSNAEKWATGSDVETDPQHNNSAKDWAESLIRLGNQAGGYPVLETIEGEEYPKIPSIYLNQVDIKEYKKITDESQLETIDAQKHDVAILVEPEYISDEEGNLAPTGELVITKSWLLYNVADDGTREWIKFGLSFATNAGYSTYANNAGNAQKINSLTINGILSEADYNTLPNKEGIYFVEIAGD